MMLSDHMAMIIPVNFSNSFVLRCRCKKCGSPPNIKNAQFRSFRAFFKGSFRPRMTVYGETTDNPLDVNGPPKHIIKQYGFNPQWNKNFRYPKQMFGASNITDFVACPCGKTKWAFRGHDDRKETQHRRSSLHW